MFDNWCNEAALLLDDASAAEIDSVAAEFVHAGPFFVLNLAHGNPIIVETNTLQADEEGAHYRPAPVFRSVERWTTVAPGKRGRRSPPSARARDPRPAAGRAAVADRSTSWIAASASAADLDLGCRLALGFRRGPLELMRSLGAAEVRAHARALRARAPRHAGAARAIRPPTCRPSATCWSTTSDGVEASSPCAGPRR